MRTEDVRRHYATPIGAPAYPPMLPKYIDREYLNIFYRTDPDAVRAVTPEPLEIEDPIVRFEVMKMNEVTGYGPYTEAGQAISVSYQGEPGEYLRAMYLDSFPAAAGGREVGAYPKVLGSPSLYLDNAALVGTLDYGTIRVATATMGYKHHAMDPDDARAQISIPTYMLKFAPDYDASMRACELVRTEITDIEVKQAWTAPARLQLFEHVLAPLADLPVLEIISASHIVTDLTLGPMKPVHDYLEAGVDPAAPTR